MSIMNSIAISAGKHLKKYSSEKAKQEYTEDDIEKILSYGSIRLLNKSIRFIFIFSIALLLGLFKTTFVFMCTFYFIRKYFGGFHFKNDYLCLIFTILLSLTCGLIALKVNLNLYVILGSYIFAITTIHFKGLVENPKKQFKKENKRITPDLKKKLFKIGKCIFTIIFAIHIYMFLNSYIVISNAITLAVITAFTNLYFCK